MILCRSGSSIFLIADPFRGPVKNNNFLFMRKSVKKDIFFKYKQKFLQNFSSIYTPGPPDIKLIRIRILNPDCIFITKNMFVFFKDRYTDIVAFFIRRKVKMARKKGSLSAEGFTRSCKSSMKAWDEMHIKAFLEKNIFFHFCVIIQPLSDLESDPVKKSLDPDPDSLNQVPLS
jgi:hypothetical protein